MEVSNSRKKLIAAAPTSALSPVNSSENVTEAELGGSQLIDTLVTLTGLPEPFAHQELDQILSLSGHEASDRADLTLDDLRQALITYLEALRPEDDFDESESLSSSSSQAFDA
jgi:hypothetical protein